MYVCAQQGREKRLARRKNVCLRPARLGKTTGAREKGMFAPSKVGENDWRAGKMCICAQQGREKQLARGKNVCLRPARLGKTAGARKNCAFAPSKVGKNEWRARKMCVCAQQGREKRLARGKNVCLRPARSGKTIGARKKMLICAQQRQETKD